MHIPFFSRRKTEEAPPLTRVTEALDALNAALKDLKDDPDSKHLRPWVRSGDYRLRTRPKVMLGYWCQVAERFIVVYGED